jgi:hypothetical protein
VSRYADPAVEAAFGPVRVVLAAGIETLAGEELAGSTHDVLEERVTAIGREVMRTLLQGHLDLRAAREVRVSGGVAGTDGVRRGRIEAGRCRELVSVVGPVRVSRIAYRAPGVSNAYPADAVLNLPVESHSHGIRRLAVIESVRGSYEQASAAIERSTGVRVGTRQVRQLVQAAAVDIDSFYAVRTRSAVESTHVLVLTFDGKGVVMRPQALREATAKAAAAGRAKLATRLSPGEKNGRKRMAELACVYDAAPAVRGVDDVIARPGKPPTAPLPASTSKAPTALNKWLTGSLTKPIAQMVAAGFDEAERRDPTNSRAWLVLVDGNRTQIDAVAAEAAHRGVQVTVLIDLIHVLEYLWAAAWSFFDKGEPAAEEWVTAQARKILHGQARQVAAGIRRRATRFGYTTSERKGADDAARYLTNHAPHLDYPTALANGWPIATGVIEGACRHLIKDRLDLTGARWNLPGAEAILTLRALNTIGDLPDYWTHHLNHEHQRHHHQTVTSAA